MGRRAAHAQRVAVIGRLGYGECGDLPECAGFVFDHYRCVQLGLKILGQQAADLQELQACFKRLKKTARSNSSAANRLAAKSQLYACLLKGSGNEVLTQILNLLNTRIMLLRATSIQQEGRWQQSVNELEVLVGALADRDAAAARTAAARHVANAAAAALTKLREQDESQDAARN